MTELLTRAALEKFAADGKRAARFLSHIETLEKFLAAVSGVPRVLVTVDDCCAQCGAPERTFRSWLRQLSYAERESA